MKAVFPIGEIVRGFWSLLQGLDVTIREFFKPTVTVHYPRETLKMAPRYRGHIEMLKDPATSAPVCTACTLCQKACPSGCITLTGGKSEEMRANPKVLGFYRRALRRASGARASPRRQDARRRGTPRALRRARPSSR